ncbi:MAG: UbiX family flavin prenyltransferase [Bacteroidetes bacterium]|nr:UbiX family flavin prenyltransferase [Bacteroidota bacterium]
MSKRVVVAVTGASGSVYAKVLLDKLLKINDQWEKVGVVMSDNARIVWKFELNDDSYQTYPFDFYGKSDFNAPFASGSANYDTMIVVPCSMGTMGRMAHGVSNDLVTRAADVVLKERRKLIIVPRETPYNLIHIDNMKLLTLAGAIICPASPSFYSRPVDFEALAATVVDRVLHLAGFKLDSYRWGEDSTRSSVQ